MKQDRFHYKGSQNCVHQSRDRQQKIYNHFQENSSLKTLPDSQKTMTANQTSVHKDYNKKTNEIGHELNHSVRRLNHLADALNAKRYLEIGVETGSTFFQVSCAEKTGVDPCFLFDLERHSEDKEINLYNCTSDQFFSKIGNEATYDLIFVDGLHTFEQTYRDILNSLMHSHGETVILIDDTVPCDVFSACRDQSECLSLRRELLGSDDIRWHGDTYKVIPLLSVFNAHLALATIIDRGNPQTMIWKPKTPVLEDPIRVTQAMWALQNLAAADYLWMLENFSLFNPVSESEALDQVVKSLDYE